mgnify:CR=1 FL=1
MNDILEKTDKKVKVYKNLVIKFSGDSGDGMQLCGNFFGSAAAAEGYIITTFPDYPAEIRPPQNTIDGVSGFQVNFGAQKFLTFGEKVDILFCLNPASLKVNLKWLHTESLLIVDEDSFTKSMCDKCGFTTNPLEDDSLNNYYVIKLPITTYLKKLSEIYKFEQKSVLRSKNIFILGIALKLTNLKKNYVEGLITKKFKENIHQLNKVVLDEGYNYLEKNGIDLKYEIRIEKPKLSRGKYININGNTAIAYGLVAAAEKANLTLYCGSYPITPATEILAELSALRYLGVKTLQAEDEIAGICSAIGASFAGALGVTSTSGPGFSLKSEALGLAVMVELPLVVVNVQRGGPSTGLPTKSEQTDLLQALFGRNGEAPLVVMAAESPADCFYSAYMAAKITLEHMTPVVLLSDGSLAQGSELFKIPNFNDLPPIKLKLADPNKKYNPYERDPETLSRFWAIPGTSDLRHRIGGLEKSDITGIVSTDPINHEKMVRLREEKVKRIANYIPLQDVYGENNGDLLVVSWGSTKNVIRNVVHELLEKGKKIGHAHFKYIMPLPKNTSEIFKKFKKIVVCEMNTGQFVFYLRGILPEFKYYQINKIQHVPFTREELINNFIKIMEE